MSRGGAADAPRFDQLVPPPGDGGSLTATEVLSGWREERRGRPGVALNMIASVDGRIAVAGHSGPLGGPADRALFHALRARADAVMVAAGTVRAERYGPIIKSPQVRAQRAAAGLPEQPLAVIVSRRLELDPSLALLADPRSHVVILTPSPGEIEPCAARVDYVRTPTLRAGLEALRDRWGARVVLCEGGPSLNASLAAESLIAELFLTISPLLVGDVADGESLLRGGAPATPLDLELRALLRHEGQLYAHYVSRS